MDDRLYRIENKGKFGFINGKGKVIINPLYDYARNFSEGVAWVNIGGIRQPYGCTGGKWGFIDQKGKIVKDLELDLVDIVNFTEGLSWVMIGKNKYNGKWGIIKINGEWLIEPIYGFSHAYSFSEGVAIVETKRKKGFVNQKGEIIFKPQFDSVGLFNDGIAWVNKGAEEDEDGFLVGGKWAFVNERGEFLSDYNYEDVQSFNKGVAWVRKSKKGNWGLIDTHGNQILEFLYEKVFNFYDNKALVKLNSGWMFIHRNGDVIKTLPKEIQNIDSYHNGITLVVINNKFGFMNKHGEIILDPLYTECKDSELAAWVKDGKNWKTFNKVSRRLIELRMKIDMVESFINDTSKIWVNGNKWGLVDMEGNILAEPKYDCIGPSRNGYIWVNIGGSIGYSGIRGGKWGLIDTARNWITKPTFDWIWDFWGGELLDAKIGDEKGYVNWEGKVVWME